MRKFLIFFTIIIFISTTFYLLIFTQKGNNYIKPYLEKSISNKLGYQVKTKSITIEPNYINIEVVSKENNSSLKINGDINLLKISFNLKYTLNTQKIHTPFFTIKEPVTLNGKMIGKLNNFYINGSGRLLNSKVEFKSTFLNRKTETLTIYTKGMKIENILTLFHKPIYSKGLFDIQMNLNSKDGKNFSGNSKIKIYFATIENKTLKKIYNFDLNKTITYRGVIESSIQQNRITNSGKILSNVAVLKFDKTIYNINNQQFSTFIDLNLRDLTLLEPIMKHRLKGSIDITAVANYTNNFLNIKANSKKFGGNIDIELEDKKLNISLNNLNLTKILKMLSYKRYFSANLNANITMDNYMNLEGKANLNIKNGKFYSEKIFEEYGIRLPKDSTFKADINCFTKDKFLYINSTAAMNSIQLKSKQTLLSLINGAYKGDYTLSIGDLEDLEFLTKIKIRGDADINGTFTCTDNQLSIDGKSNFLNSKSSFVYDNEILDIIVNNVSTLKLSHMLFLPEIFDSYANSHLKYNFTSKTGNFSVISENGKLKDNQINKIVYDKTDVNLSNETFENTILKGKIGRENIRFNLFMSGKNSMLEIKNGYTNIDNQEISAKFFVKISDKKVYGNIEGKIYNPTIYSTSSKYFKNLIQKRVKENIPDKPVKNLLKLFEID